MGAPDEFDAEALARQRLEAFFVALDRLTPDALGRIAMTLADPGERSGVRAELDDAAARAGRVELVASAREAAREAVLTRYRDALFRPTWAGLNWGLSSGRAEDQAALAIAVEDAAAAAVLEDVLDPDLAAGLVLEVGHAVAIAPTTPEGAFTITGTNSRAVWLAIALAILVSLAVALSNGGAP